MKKLITSFLMIAVMLFAARAVAASKNVAMTGQELAEAQAKIDAAAFKARDMKPGVHKMSATLTTASTKTTTTLYLWVHGDKTLSQRMESTTVKANPSGGAGGASAGASTVIRIKDADGEWTIFPAVKEAVLKAPPSAKDLADAGKEPMAVVQKQIDEAPPEKRRALAEKYWKVTGEHCVEQGRECLRVTEKATSAWQKLVNKYAIEQTTAEMKEMKKDKDVPFSERLAMSLGGGLATLWLKISGSMSKAMRVQTDTTFDRADWTIVSIRTYNPKGKMLTEELSGTPGGRLFVPEPCADFATENFLIPADYTRHKPRTYDEERKLLDKLTMQCGATCDTGACGDTDFLAGDALGFLSGNGQ